MLEYGKIEYFPNKSIGDNNSNAINYCETKIPKKYNWVINLEIAVYIPSRWWIWYSTTPPKLISPKVVDKLEVLFAEAAIYDAMATAATKFNETVGRFSSIVSWLGMLPEVIDTKF